MRTSGLVHCQMNKHVPGAPFLVIIYHFLLSNEKSAPHDPLLICAETTRSQAGKLRKGEIDGYQRDDQGAEGELPLQLDKRAKQRSLRAQTSKWATAGTALLFSCELQASMLCCVQANCFVSPPNSLGLSTESRDARRVLET